MSLGQSHLGKNWLLDGWTSNSFVVTNLWYYYGHQGQGHPKVKLIPESNYRCLDFYEKGCGESSTECILVYCEGAS